MNLCRLCQICQSFSPQYSWTYRIIYRRRDFSRWKGRKRSGYWKTGKTEQRQGDPKVNIHFRVCLGWSYPWTHIPEALGCQESCHILLGSVWYWTRPGIFFLMGKLPGASTYQKCCGGLSSLRKSPDETIQFRPRKHPKRLLSSSLHKMRPSNQQPGIAWHCLKMISACPPSPTNFYEFNKWWK